jgi:hypothetical protein
VDLNFSLMILAQLARAVSAGVGAMGAVLTVRFDARRWIWHGAMARANMRLERLGFGGASAGGYEAR